MSKETIVESIYALGRKVLAKFNLTDAGKVDNFISKIVKSFKSEVKSIETNLKIKEVNYETSVDSLKEKIEDAEQAVIEAELCMPLGELQTNAEQNSYLTIYLDGIEKAESKLKTLKNQLSDLETSYKADVDDLNKQIELYKEKIAKFDKK